MQTSKGETFGTDQSRVAFFLISHNQHRHDLKAALANSDTWLPHSTVASQLVVASMRRRQVGSGGKPVPAAPQSGSKRRPSPSDSPGLRFIAQFLIAALVVGGVYYYVEVLNNNSDTGTSGSFQQ